MFLKHRLENVPLKVVHDRDLEFDNSKYSSQADMYKLSSFDIFCKIIIIVVVLNNIFDNYTS